jgi:hypothetical protein
MTNVDDIDVDNPAAAEIPPSDPSIVDEKITAHANQEGTTPISEPVSSEAAAPVDPAVPEEQLQEPEEQPQENVDALPESTPAARRHESPGDDRALTEAAIIERLKTPVAGIDFASIRLIDLVRMVGNLAGVPITIDVAALERLGIEPATTVTVRAAEKTAGEVLQQALATLRLAHRVAGDQVTVGARSGDDEQRSVKYRVDDLLGDGLLGNGLLGNGESAAEELASQIQRLVAPESWTAGGSRGTVEVDGGTLIVQQTAAVHYEIFAFCERLRLARGLALRSKNPRGRFPLASRRALAADRLNRPVTFTFDQPVRLRAVADYLEETTGTLILIDWASLQAADFLPSTLISCAVDQQPLGEALTAMLAPLELGWLAENADTIRIVSRAEASPRPEVAFYDVSVLVASGLEREEIETRVRQAAGDGAEATGDQAMPGVVEWDEASGRIIVRHTQEAHERIGAALADGR